MSNIVAGKLAFVTGAGSGIGREVCQVLAREGAKVIAADRNIRAVQETITFLKGSDHLALDVDVSNPHKIAKTFKNIVDKFSTAPTIVVNSAGITRDNFLLKLNETEFDDVINVNLKGTFLVMQSAVNAMIETGTTEGSSIVNVSSITGKVGNIGQSNYSASKAGVEALTKTASIEFGKLGIRVNTVLPGFIETPMTATVPDNVKNIFVKRISLERIGKPNEVAEVIAFLASNKSSYVTGASIEVTGGMH